MSEVRVELYDSGEVKKTVKGVLLQSAVRRRRCVFSSLLASLSSSSSLSSLIGFGAGLFCSLLFGAMLLFTQKFGVWGCAYITVGVACVSGFAMGISKAVRADAAVMLPSFCSGHGRTLVSLILVSVLISGPIANSLHNIELGASSLFCSSQLAANQTQKMLQKATSPLSGVLDSLQEISNNAFETAGRIRKMINTLSNSVRHIARTLRNQLHFLVEIRDICNKEMGAPNRKCLHLFKEATKDCKGLLGDFDFLCEIVDGFTPLCDMAKAGELFCIIPSYVVEQLKENLVIPVVGAFENLKKEFLFDLDASVKFDLEADSSQSLQGVTQQILKEVTSKLHLLEMLSHPLNYIVLLLLLWNYYKAARYRRRYLRNLDFDNVYINTGFKELDHHVTSGGGVSVLPITARESQVYISPFSFRLSNREKRVMLKGISSMVRHLLMSGVLVALDFLIFWILDQVQHQASSDIIARAPVQFHLSVTGSGFAADIYRDLVHSFQTLQSHNLTVFSRACVVQPRHPDISTSVTIGFLLGLSLLLVVCGGFIQRTKRVICAWFHPHREQERLCHLRSKILNGRRHERRTRNIAFFTAPPFRSRDQGRFWELLLSIPGVSKLLQILNRRITCVSCAEPLNQDSSLHCDTPTCSAVYCHVCLLRWKNSCLGCGHPLTSLDDLSDLELGSSDEEESGPEHYI